MNCIFKGSPLCKKSCDLKNPKCIDFEDDRAIIVLKEPRNKSQYIGNNFLTRVFTGYRVDGKLIASTTERKCDFLLLNTKDKTAYFIELKGSDIQSAIKQINNTLQKVLPGLKGYNINVRIVLTKVSVHGLRGSDYLNLKNLLKRLNGCLKSSSTPLKEDLQ